MKKDLKDKFKVIIEECKKRYNTPYLNIQEYHTFNEDLEETDVTYSMNFFISSSKIDIEDINKFVDTLPKDFSLLLDVFIINKENKFTEEQYKQIQENIKQGVISCNFMIRYKEEK